MNLTTAGIHPQLKWRELYPVHPWRRGVLDDARWKRVGDLVREQLVPDGDGNLAASELLMEVSDTSGASLLNT